MKVFNIYKKRDGGLFEKCDCIYAYDYAEAKKRFAMICYYNLINGTYGDCYIEQTQEFIDELIDRKWSKC